MISELQNQLGIDKSFFVELLLFVSLYLWLSGVLFAPYLDLRRRRRAGTDGLKKQAADAAAAAAANELARAQLLLGARKEAALAREAALLDARGRASALVGEAKARARAHLLTAREESAACATREMEQLRVGVAPLSELLVARLTEKRAGL